MCGRYPAVFAHWLADAQVERHPEAPLSGALFSKPGDLGDLTARLKAAEILAFSRRRSDRVGQIHGGQREQPPNHRAASQGIGVNAVY